MSILNKSLLVLLLTSLAGCGQQLVEFGYATTPTVTSTDPGNAATGVGVSRTVNATFSEQMDPTTISATTFTLKQGATPIAGTVRYAGLTATFTPAADLTANTFTATVTTGAKSAASATGLTADYTWSFTTAPGTAIPPAVTSTDPGNSSTGVLTSKQVSAVFSKAMTASTLNTTTFTLKQGATAVPGAVTYVGTTATFAPTSPLATSTTYDATITTGAKDLAGVGLAANYTWSFTTAAPGASPTVISTDPGNGSTGVLTSKQPAATFSRAMAAGTITATTFTLKQGVNAIAGGVSYAGTTATFAPTNPLATSTTYDATITTGATDAAGIALAVPFTWSFTTAAPPAPPTVTSSDPAGGAIGVVTNKQLSAVFSTPMAPATISQTTFTLKQGVNPVAGGVSYAGTTATFVPTSLLAASTTYDATITTGATDLAGTALAAPFTWSFTTGLVPVPRLISTLPLSGATLVPLNAVSSATFNEPMNPATITTATFTVTCASPCVSPAGGVVTYAGNTATFTPAAGSLVPLTQYTSTITAGAKDPAGNPLVSGPIANPWSWTTGPAADTTPPTVTLTSPADLATLVPVAATISATFSEAMDQGTMIPANFTVKETLVPANTVAGQIAYNGQNNTATFLPGADLKADTDFTVTVTNNARDLAGNALVVPAVSGLPKPNPWTFKTAPAVGPTLVINLGAASTFGVAATAGVTNTPTTPITHINGDVVLDPVSGATCNSVAVDGAGGFGLCGGSPPTITGKVISQLYDPTNGRAAVLNDLKAAFLSITPPAGPPAAGSLAGAIDLPAGTTLGAAAGSAMVLGDNWFGPGVYQSITSIMVTGDLTLDAQNNPNAVFVFQSSSTVGTADGAPSPGTHSRILLVNGAKASNVWWQAGTSATLGLYSEFQGNILASASITMLTGATSCGRLLAGAFTDGAFVFDANVVSVPGNASAPASCK